MFHHHHGHGHDHGLVRLCDEGETSMAAPGMLLKYGATDGNGHFRCVERIHMGGPVRASNEFFGSDPIPGVRKALYVSQSPASGMPIPGPGSMPMPAPQHHGGPGPGFAHVCDEGGTTMANPGALLKFGAADGHGHFRCVERVHMGGPVYASNEFFGSDPIPGVRKALYINQGAASGFPQPGGGGHEHGPGYGFVHVCDEGGTTMANPGALLKFGAADGHGHFRCVERVHMGGPVYASNDFFGSDPIPGVRKALYINLGAASGFPQPGGGGHEHGPGHGFVHVCDEGGTAMANPGAMLKFGAADGHGHFRCVERVHMGGPVYASNDFFGSDPIPGVRKALYVRQW